MEPKSDIPNERLSWNPSTVRSRTSERVAVARFGRILQADGMPTVVLAPCQVREKLTREWKKWGQPSSQWPLGKARGRRIAGQARSSSFQLSPLWRPRMSHSLFSLGPSFAGCVRAILRIFVLRYARPAVCPLAALRGDSGCEYRLAHLHVGRTRWSLRGDVCNV